VKLSTGPLGNIHGISGEFPGYDDGIYGIYAFIKGMWAAGIFHKGVGAARNFLTNLLLSRLRLILLIALEYSGSKNCLNNFNFCY
jgi:hypothetical protein